MPKKVGKEESDAIAAASLNVLEKNATLQIKILENLVELQKVHTTLAEKFDSLNTSISSLLTLFEKAARSFAENPLNQVSEKDKDFLEKIDRLLEQNKVIAKGLTLMEERIRERVYGSVQPAAPAQQPQQVFTPSPAPIPYAPVNPARGQVPQEENTDEISIINKPLPKF